MLSDCSIYNNEAGTVSGALHFPAATASFAHVLPLPAAARCAALPLAARLAGRGVWRQLGVRWTSATRRGVGLGGLFRVGEVEWGGYGVWEAARGGSRRVRLGWGEEGRGAWSCGLWV